MVKATL
jgi:hypothetical protein